VIVGVGTYPHEEGFSNEVKLPSAIVIIFPLSISSTNRNGIPLGKFS
jgi:hypothetical protein